MLRPRVNKIRKKMYRIQGKLLSSSYSHVYTTTGQTFQSNHSKRQQQQQRHARCTRFLLHENSPFRALGWCGHIRSRAPRCSNKCKCIARRSLVKKKGGHARRLFQIRAHSVHAYMELVSTRGDRKGSMPNTLARPMLCSYIICSMQAICVLCAQPIIN